MRKNWKLVLGVLAVCALCMALGVSAIASRGDFTLMFRP